MQNCLQAGIQFNIWRNFYSPLCESTLWMQYILVKIVNAALLDQVEGRSHQQTVYSLAGGQLRGQHLPERPDPQLCHIPPCLNVAPCSEGQENQGNLERINL